jgi:hypothetical protein
MCRRMTRSVHWDIVERKRVFRSIVVLGYPVSETRSAARAGVIPAFAFQSWARVWFVTRLRIVSMATVRPIFAVAGKISSWTTIACAFSILTVNLVDARASSHVSAKQSWEMGPTVTKGLIASRGAAPGSFAAQTTLRSNLAVGIQMPWPCSCRLVPGRSMWTKSSKRRRLQVTKMQINTT